MDIQKILDDHDFILTESGIIESLRRSGDANLHPRLENALLIYEEVGKRALSKLYQDFIKVARKGGVPITICTPTWRANQERLSTAYITNDVNGDAVKFLKHLKDRWGSWAENIFIGGLVGCKNDCYKPDEGLSKNDAKAFHFWQINQLAKAGVDFLIGATLPALPEATGIALSMAKANVPYIISFVINREGKILDGNSLEHSFRKIDAVCSRPPLGYMINCAYPSFLNAHKQPQLVLSRLIGFQANASSLDNSKLDGAGALQTDDISDWGNLMIELNKKFGVRILGGCCGTNYKHLQYIVQNVKNLNSEQMSVENTKKTRNELRQDAGLVKLLRTAVDQAAGVDGWSHLGRVGQYISNKTSFSPINYGYKKLGDLIRVCDLFEIKMKNDNSVMYIKDSRN